MTTDGTFREDLWYRISAFQILVPPLRRRIEDLEALTKHFVHRAAHRFGLPVPTWSRDDLATLAAYRWPGNIREFGAVVDRAVLLARDSHIDVGAALGVPAASRTIPLQRASGLPSTPPMRPGRPTIPPGRDVSLESMTVAHIETVLLECHGRIEGPFGAATRLRINPNTLRSRLRKLGVNARKFRRR
jgi:DNA-binding NtrC family response regulator